MTTMAEKHSRRYWYWRLADIVPQGKRYTGYTALYNWLFLLGPYISTEAGKGWTLGFNFYLFGFLISRQAAIWNMDSRFTGLELFWIPSRWIPSRMKPGDCIWRHQRRIGRYYPGR